MVGDKKSWQVPACPNLTTLCVRFQKQFRKKYTCTYFSNLKSMKQLRVLDLSGNYFLERVPSEIGELINLEFLNLSRTIFLFGLPIEMKKLIKLRVFLMEDVQNDRGVIPLEVIESLKGLKVFRISTMVIRKYPRFEWDPPTLVVNGKKEMKILEKLESLPNLEELCIQLTTISNVHKLLSSTKLRGCTRHIKICFYRNKEDYSLEMPSLLASFSEMKQILESIHLQGIKNLIEESSTSLINDRCYLGMLRHVNIDKCDSITHLTWLRHAPLLEYLKVSNCASIKHLVTEVEDEEVELFQNLTHIYRLYLPKLESIHKTALTFPLLKLLYVSKCPNLRKLPFNSSFFPNDNLIAIQGETSWWKNLEWENKDQTFQHLLHSKFQPKFESNIVFTTGAGSVTWAPVEDEEVGELKDIERFESLDLILGAGLSNTNAFLHH